jgi:hypothetical protein
LGEEVRLILVGIPRTAWNRVEDTLLFRPLSVPLYVATMSCSVNATVPGVVEQVAVPADKGTAVHPVIDEPLSVKATVPPPGSGLTVAV